MPSVHFGTFMLSVFRQLNEILRWLNQCHNRFSGICTILHSSTCANSIWDDFSSLRSNVRSQQQVIFFISSGMTASHYYCLYCFVKTEGNYQTHLNSRQCLIFFNLQTYITCMYIYSLTNTCILSSEGHMPSVNPQIRTLQSTETCQCFQTATNGNHHRDWQPSTQTDVYSLQREQILHSSYFHHSCEFNVVSYKYTVCKMFFSPSCYYLHASSTSQLLTNRGYVLMYTMYAWVFIQYNRT